MSWFNLLRDKGRWTVFTLVILTLGTAWIIFSRLPATVAAHGEGPASPRQGFKAPDFSLDLLGGGKVTLSDLRGKPIVVNLWASWCPPCRAEMPAIEKVYRDYQSLGLVVLGVNTTNQDSEGDAAAFVSQYGLTFPIPLDRDGLVSALYMLQGLPSTYFIDREGTIRSVVIGGPMSEAVIRSKVEDLLKEQP